MKDFFDFKTKKGILSLVIFLSLLVLLTNIGLGVYLQQQAFVDIPTASPSPAKIIENPDTFSYKGENGKNALQILKEKTAAEQNSSGLVISINRRQADKAKREYWAFYVNGKLASVGPKDYLTKNTDKIEWRIEKY